MNIYVTGVNYKTTPLEIREKLSFSTDEQKEMLVDTREIKDVEECVLVSTCNRTEVYIYTQKADFDTSLVEKLLCGKRTASIYEMKKYFYTYRGTKAVKHLYEVTCGLDSLVLGEDQILGQVKGAHGLALEAGVSSGVLNTLFRGAITAAKKVKTETELSRNSLSIGSVAVKLATEAQKGQLLDKCALIIGTGKIGTLALKHLIATGIGKVYITNRSHGRAMDLSLEYENVHSVDYLERYSVMDQCDIIISSTSSPHYTITRDMLEKSIHTSKVRVFIDLAVPRDIDDDIADLSSVRYFNIDHLQAEVAENTDRRMAEASRAREIIDEHVREYTRWYQFRGVLPVVREVQKYAEDLLNEKISHTFSRLKSAGEEDRETVKAALTATVNEMLNKLVYNVREYGNKEDMEAYFRCLGEVMKADEEREHV